MHLPFLNRSNIKSPFRQILHTPGLVACYLPYMDVVGRNVSRYTSIGGISRMTVNGDTCLETTDNGTHLISLSQSGDFTSGVVFFSVTITPIGRRRFAIGSTIAPWGVIFDTTTESVIWKGENVISSGVTPNGDGSYNLYSLVNYTSGWGTLYSMPDNATSMDEREFVGDIAKGFACSKWQVNLGQSYPYSAPVGLSQSVVDRTGLGNTVQRGSTSGADTNDPTWSPVSLYFDGVDDVIANEPVADYALYAWGATNSAFGWVSEIPATAGYWFGGIRMSRTPGASEEARLKANIATLLAGQGVTIA